MPADPDTPRGRRVLSKDRMEGFSDGVFGFAATLLVLGIALRPPGTPLLPVLHAWPAYLAYAVSFLTIGGTWLQPSVRRIKVSTIPSGRWCIVRKCWAGHRKSDQANH